MKVASVVGARPQFVKAAPVSRELRKRHNEVLIHTGQHYDENMSAAFFDALAIPDPDFNLGIGSGSHGAQTGRMLEALDGVLHEVRPDIVLVFGDTNSTLAGALAAAKLHLPLAHVEAGLRSHDRSMPEEINRIVADRVSDLLLCPTATAVENLRREGITTGVNLVGDVMYDVALASVDASRKRRKVEALSLRPGTYLLTTVHRASNTDDVHNLRSILEALGRAGETIVFPIHPRTRAALEANSIRAPPNIHIVDPLDYLDFLDLLRHARRVVTDSGGIQKEAFFAGVPCITLRRETEWPETVEDGWNTLVGADPGAILAALQAPEPAKPRGNHFGDGHAARHAVEALEAWQEARCRGAWPLERP